MSAFPSPGFYVDLIVPCDANGRMLPRELIAHLRKIARVREAQGIVVNGPAGEGAALDRDGRAAVLEVALSGAPTGWPVVAAIPATSDDAEAEAISAQAAGAAAVQVTDVGDDDVGPALEAILSVIDVPVIVRASATTVSSLTPAILAGVAAVVITDGHPGAVPGGRPVLVTDELLNADDLLPAGCAGAVLGSANVAPELWGKTFRLHTAGDASGAAELYAERLMPLTEACVAVQANGHGGRGTALVVKHALAVITQNSTGATFPPLVELGAGEGDHILTVLTAGRLMPGSG